MDTLLPKMDFGISFLASYFWPAGLRTLTDSLWSYLLVAAGLLLFIYGRKMITLPRLGEIKFGPKRKTRRLTLLILIMVAVALTFAVLAAARSRYCNAWTQCGAALSPLSSP